MQSYKIFSNNPESFLLIALNIAVALFITFVLLTNVPNPASIVFLIVVYTVQAYYFRASKIKIVSLLVLFISTLWLLVSVMDTSAISMKCAPELRKDPNERIAEIVLEETKNFDSCLNSLTIWDKVVYGLLK